MMNFFYSNLKYLREQKRLSQSELARRTQKICEEYNQQSTSETKATPITQASIARWEANENSPSIDNLVILARALDVSLPELIGNDLKIDNAVVMNEEEKVKIPVLGIIPAGTPMEAIEDIIDYIEIPKEWTRGGKEFFALQLKGDSMFPKYNDGDIVIFKKTPDCNSGDEVCVMVNGDDATFKRLLKYDSGITLQPLNTAYDIKMYSNKDIKNLPIRVLGVAVEMRRKV